MKPENQDILCHASEEAKKKWESVSNEIRHQILEKFALTHLVFFHGIYNCKFDQLPEIFQLMLSLAELEQTQLEKFAIEEGFLNGEERFLLRKDVAIAIIAGSIHRGSTATVVCPQVQKKLIKSAKSA